MLHAHSGAYDWTQHLENWESALLSYDSNDMYFKYEGYKEIPGGRLYSFTGNYTGIPMNGEDQYLEVQGYATQNDYDYNVNDPALNDTYGVNTDQPFQLPFNAPTLYCFKYRIVDNDNVGRTSAWKTVLVQ